MKNQRNDSDMSLNQKNRVKQEKEWNGGNEKNTNVYQKMSFFQYLSMYAFWVMCNTFLVLLSFFLDLVVQKSFSFESSTVFLFFIGLEILFLMIYGIVENYKKLSEWVLIWLNLFGLLSCYFLLRPETIREWMILLCIGSVFYPFCVNVLSNIKEMQVLYNLSKDSKKSFHKTLDELQPTTKQKNTKKQ